MQFRLDWIAEYVELPGGVEETAKVLTSVGLTTDGWEECGETWLLDLDIPANRGDVQSHRGIAREIAAACQVELKPIPVEFPGVSLSGIPSDLITIESPELCRRYTAQILEDLAPGSSPVWVEDRLESLGLRPLSNIVDATNLVLLELGQPMHAFDMDKLAGGRIVVRRAKEGETLVTLDEVERKLSADDLVIADTERPIALAGIMGGLDTMITDDTSRVLLESAWFDPRTVRTTASRLGMRTDASVRFERGADPEATVPAAARFCNLMEQLGGGKYSAEMVDVYPQRESWSATLRWDRAEAIMGMTLDREKLTKIFASLGYKLENDDASAPSFRVPSWRGDVRREIDMVEEAARHHGFDHIPSTLPGWSQVHVSPSAERQSRRESFRDASAAAGFLETIHFSFVSEREDSEYRYRNGEGAAPPSLTNPLVQHQKVMRGSLLPGLLASAQRNFARGQSCVSSFELGKRFWANAEGDPQEAWTLAFLLAGSPPRSSAWESSAEEACFFDLKGSVEAVLEARGVVGVEFSVGEWSFLHPAESSSIAAGGNFLGPMGRLHPDAAARAELEVPVYVAELDLTSLLEQPRIQIELQASSRFPWADRDLSLYLPSDVSWAQVASAIDGLGQEDLLRAWPVDRYAGKGVPQGKVSLTVRLRYQRTDRTLLAEEAMKRAEAVVECLATTLGAEQRT